MSGTIVYVHGASDRGAGVADHVRRIRESLAARGSDMAVVAADWGDAVGPTLERVLVATPSDELRTGRPRAGRPKPATRERGLGRLVQGVAGGIVALQYLNVKAPARVRLWATDVLLERRDALMQEILGVADVLVYQRAGDAIREHVSGVLGAVTDAARPLIALGNSLGGIVLFDLLRDPASPRPDLFVTVGSQAPVLETFGGLGVDARPPFQPWLNIYDRRDVLAFIARPVWPDQAGIEDLRVDLGLGFPEVHGPAYLSDRSVFDAILARPELAAGSGPRASGQG
jgi:hypothetical protein